jgi:hypothetical protein
MVVEAVSGADHLFPDNKYFSFRLVCRGSLIEKCGWFILPLPIAIIPLEIIFQTFLITEVEYTSSDFFSYSSSLWDIGLAIGILNKFFRLR